jgi:hypothetical protein
VKGIEPSYSAWKAAALPLSYTRFCSLLLFSQSIASTAKKIPRSSRPNTLANPKIHPKRTDGRCRIRTYVGIANGFTVRPL